MLVHRRCTCQVSPVGTNIKMWDSLLSQILQSEKIGNGVMVDEFHPRNWIQTRDVGEEAARPTI